MKNVCGLVNLRFVQEKLYLREIIKYDFDTIVENINHLRGFMGGNLPQIPVIETENTYLKCLRILM